MMMQVMTSKRRDVLSVYRITISFNFIPSYALFIHSRASFIAACNSHILICVSFNTSSAHSSVFPWHKVVQDHSLTHVHHAHSTHNTRTHNVIHQPHSDSRSPPFMLPFYPRASHASIVLPSLVMNFISRTFNVVLNT